MTGYVLIGGIVLIVALVGLAIYAAYRAGREDGYEQGYGDARQEKLTEDRRQRAVKAGRHRAGQPRASTSPAPAAVTPEPKRSGYRDSWFTAAVWPMPVAKPAVTAESIDTVLLAPQPSPHLTGAADTGTLAKVSITSTGDMPVLTDSFIADLEMREAAYRKEHAESEA